MNMVLQLRCATLYLLAVAAFWLTPASATDIDPVLHGSDTICNEGGWVKFTCEGASVWMMNTSYLNHRSVPGEYSITSAHGRNILDIKCLVKFNSSVIFCFDGVSGRQSNNVSFLVQGLLGPVSDLVYLPHNQTLSWKPPFQLNTSQAITYNILVTEVTVDQPVVGLNQSETYLDLTEQLERGSTYNASLWPLNAVGRGQETSVMFTEEPAATSSSVVTGSNGGTTPTPSVDPDQLTSRMRKALAGALGGLVLLAIVIGLTVVILIMIYRIRRNGKTKGGEEEQQKPVVETSMSEEQPSYRGLFRGNSQGKIVPDLARKRRKV